LKFTYSVVEQVTWAKGTFIKREL